MKKYDYVKEWPTSHLVTHLARSVMPRSGIIDGALDLAAARELDRRLPKPEPAKRVKQNRT